MNYDLTQTTYMFNDFSNYFLNDFLEQNYLCTTEHNINGLKTKNVKLILTK